MKSELLPSAPIRVQPRRLGRSSRRTSQLDFALPLAKGPCRAPSGPPAGSRARAQWWFTQMRQIVAEGRDFDAAGVF